MSVPNGSDGPKKPQVSFLRSMQVVAWAFMGLRGRSESQDDISRVNPVHLVIAGIIGALGLVFLCIGLVNWVLP